MAEAGGGSILPVHIALNEILGYTGCSMLCLNAVPPVVASIREFVDISAATSTGTTITTGIMISNVVAGSFLIAYGVLEKLPPLYFTFPTLVFGNLLAIVVRCIRSWRDMRNNSLF